MSRIEYFRDGKASRFYKKIDEVAKANGRKTLPMFFDFLKCSFKYGAGLSDYVNFKFYNLTEAERSQYVTVIDTDKLYEKLNPSKYKEFVVNKAKFLHNYKDYIGRDFYTNDQSYDKMCEFLDKHEFFMEKPIDGIGGHCVKKVYSKDITDRKAYYDMILENNYLLDEYIIQHPAISEIAPNSVNTVRAITYANNGKAELIYALMRFGNGDANVDNFHQGGCAVTLNVKTGVIESDAVNKVGEVFDAHPKTKVKFKGFQVPNWDKVVEITESAALVNENLHLLGWDVAVTSDGATFVECNRRPGWDLIQTGGGPGKPLMNSILARYEKDEQEKKRSKI